MSEKIQIQRPGVMAAAEMPYWRRVNDAFTAFLRRWGLSVNAYSVMVRIYESGTGLEPAQLADSLGVKRQLIAIILNDFDRRGFIVRHPNADDRRRRTVRFTRDGAIFADRVCTAVIDLQRRGEAVFSAEEAQRFREFSERYVSAIRNAAGLSAAADTAAAQTEL